METEAQQIRRQGRRTRLGNWVRHKLYRHRWKRYNRRTR
jgi:hypothetical protein